MQGKKESSFLSLYLLIAVALSPHIVHAVPGNAVAGQAIYQRVCVSCHGMDGRGGPMRGMLKVVPRDLTDPAYMDGRSDEQLFTAIRHGGEAVERSAAMPAFADQLSEEEIWDTVAYVRTLGGRQPADQPVAAPQELMMARLRVLIWPEYDDPRVLVIMRGEMTPRQAFPTTLKLAIPKGAEIIGAGMISEANELLLHPHTVVPGDREDFLTLHLPVPRFFIEFYYAPFQTQQADKHFVYPIAAPYPIELLEVDIQQPDKATAFVTEPLPMEQVTDRQGFMHAQFVYRNLAAGETRQFAVTYTRTTTEPSVSKQQPMSSPSSAESPPRSVLGRPQVAFLILAILAVIFAAFAWIWTHRRTAQDSHPGGAAAAAMPTARTPPPAAPTARPEQPNFCSQCGHQVGPGHHFCARCGHALRP